MTNRLLSPTRVKADNRQSSYGIKWSERTSNAIICIAALAAGARLLHADNKQIDPDLCRHANHSLFCTF